MTLQFEDYTFSECITLANLLLQKAFNGSHELERTTAAGFASKWFIKAEEAREYGTARGESWFRKNYLCEVEVVPAQKLSKQEQRTTRLAALAEQQAAFLARVFVPGKCVSDITDDERAEAEKLLLKLPDTAWQGCEAW